MKITDSAGHEIKIGNRIVWEDASGEHTGMVAHNRKYTGEREVNGKSLAYLAQNCEWMHIVQFLPETGSKTSPKVSF